MLCGKSGNKFKTFARKSQLSAASSARRGSQAPSTPPAGGWSKWQSSKDKKLQRPLLALTHRCCCSFKLKTIISSRAHIRPTWPPNPSPLEAARVTITTPTGTDKYRSNVSHLINYSSAGVCQGLTLTQPSLWGLGAGFFVCPNPLPHLIICLIVLSPQEHQARAYRPSASKMSLVQEPSSEVKVRRSVINFGHYSRVLSL